MVLVVYDITDDGLRARVASVLLAYGLTRVQKSAFLGRLTRERLKDLKVRIRRMIEGERANVQFYPLCPQCFSRRSELGVPTVPKVEVLRGVVVV